MYRLGDKNEAVKDVQRFLREIGKGDDFDLPSVSVDGIYAEETREAVKYYQLLKGIDPSGIVDFETFSLLYGDYLYYRDKRESRKTVLGDGYFPYKFNDRSRDVAQINSLLSQISTYYSFINFEDSGNLYSHKTVRAVKKLQEMLLLDADGIVDENLYSMMLLLNDSLMAIE